MTSIFSKIIKREIPSDIVYENEYVIVIKDINPVAPIHLLIITKKEIPSIQDLENDDMFLLAEMAKAAQKVAHQLQLKFYRLLTNNGPESGQTIFHLHFHLISGRELGAMA